MSKEKKENKISDTPASPVLPEKIDIKLHKAFMWSLPNSEDINDRKRGVTLTRSSPGPVTVDTTKLSKAQYTILANALKTGDVAEGSMDIQVVKNADDLIALLDSKDNEGLKIALQKLIDLNAYQTISTTIIHEKEKDKKERNKSALMMMRYALKSILNKDIVQRDRKMKQEINDVLMMIGIDIFPTTYATKESERNDRKKRAKDNNKVASS